VKVLVDVVQHRVNSAFSSAKVTKTQDQQKAKWTRGRQSLMHGQLTLYDGASRKGYGRR